MRSPRLTFLPGHRATEEAPLQLDVGLASGRQTLFPCGQGPGPSPQDGRLWATKAQSRGKQATVFSGTPGPLF